MRRNASHLSHTARWIYLTGMGSGNQRLSGCQRRLAGRNSTDCHLEWRADNRGLLTEDELENLYTVPFFIWTNYETETEEVPITSLNYLSTMALERAGIALPSYNQFLADMQQTIPAINSRGYYSVSSGCFKHLEEATGKEAEWINKYQILQYNNMFDKKKQSKVFFPYLQN